MFDDMKMIYMQPENFHNSKENALATDFLAKVFNLWLRKYMIQNKLQ